MSRASLEDGCPTSWSGPEVDLEIFAGVTQELMTGATEAILQEPRLISPGARLVAKKAWEECCHPETLLYWLGRRVETCGAGSRQQRVAVSCSINLLHKYGSIRAASYQDSSDQMVPEGLALKRMQAWMCQPRSPDWYQILPEDLAILERSIVARRAMSPMTGKTEVGSIPYAMMDFVKETAMALGMHAMMREVQGFVLDKSPRPTPKSLVEHIEEQSAEMAREIKMLVPCPFNDPS